MPCCYDETNKSQKDKKQKTKSKATQRTKGLYWLTVPGHLKAIEQKEQAHPRGEYYRK